MAQITVKYDPTLEIEEIEDLIYATSEEEDPDNIPSTVQQTKMTGLAAPLIKVNNIIILWDRVTYFELNSIDTFPTLQFTFNDEWGFTKSLDQPGNDNLVLVQILPPFEDAYKKINLRFFINDVNISGTQVTISAIYNVPELYQDKLEALGKMTTYDFVDKVAKDCGLGLASNIDGTEDERYMYIRNTNLARKLENEISTSGSEDCILDVWVDYHNYLILCDLYERYNAIDDNLKVWTMPSDVNDPSNEGKEIEPIEEDAILTNANALAYTQLAIKDYTVNNSSGTSIFDGTDKVIETYYINKGESSSVLIQDGDIKKDTFIKTIYAGEVFGDFDYFSTKLCRKAFLQKVKSNTIEVELNSPLLGLERGQRVNLKWYDTNEITSSVKEDNEIETNIQDIEGDPNEKEYFSLNKQVSGQYLIIGTSIRFNGVFEGWKYKLILARPANQVNKYIGEDE